MKVNVKVEGVPDDFARIASTFIQIQWTLVKSILPALLSTAATLSNAMRELGDALREPFAEEGEEDAEADPDPADTHVAYRWPYAGYSPNLQSCEVCGWLTCRCEEHDTELDAIANP